MTRQEAIEYKALERKYGRLLDTILRRQPEETISRQFELRFDQPVLTAETVEEER